MLDVFLRPPVDSRVMLRAMTASLHEALSHSSEEHAQDPQFGCKKSENRNS